MKFKKKDWEIIARYMSGEASKGDKEYITAILSSKISKVNTFESFKKIWSLYQNDSTEWDVELAWNRLSPLLIEKTQKQSEIVSPHSRGGERFFSWRPPLTYGIQAAVIIFLIAGMSFLFKYVWGDNQIELRTQQILTENGERASIRLTDGTSVKLNVASVLRIADEFPGTREIYLEGEAYFKVKRDTEKPFIVHTDVADIEVLGTSFDVRAWEVDGVVEVVVARGRVSVKSTSPASQKEVILTKNQKSQVKPGEEPTQPTPVEAHRYLAWLRGELIFYNAPFHEVITQLERQYNLQVELADSTFLTRHLTASFGKEPIDDVLTTIAISFDLQYRRSGRTVTFYSTN